MSHAEAAAAGVSRSGWEQLTVVIVVTLVAAPLLGRYLAALFGGDRAPGDRVFGPPERLLLRAGGIDPDKGQTWTGYARSLLAFGLVSTIALFALLRLQGVLPGNPTHAPGMGPGLAFNTAVSFVTGTNWQAYSGETQVSFLAQMAGLVVAQFTAAAVGVGVALAVVRGIAGTGRDVGNFWGDLVRAVVRLFLPLAAVATVVMVSQGAVQNLAGARTVTTVTGATQGIPGGPVASMEAIKLLGTNGGSAYGVGGAHPFENPNGFTNIFDLLLVIVLPVALVLMFGRLIGRPRQAYTILAVMAVLFLGHTLVAMQAEAHGSPAPPAAVAHTVRVDGGGGNMEGKEVRFGAEGSALLTAGTMGTTAGATDSSLDSYTAVGGGSALAAILLGEVSPGGDGGGLYGMLMFVLLAVFLCGLMVGRTPEYLGKKVGVPQMKLVTLHVFAAPAVILVLSGVSLVYGSGTRSILNPGPHGLTEMTYSFASAVQNNGSAFAGLSAATPWYDTSLGIAMLVGRFLPIILVLAVAGSLAGSRVYATTDATLSTSGPTFGGLLLGLVVIVGGLTFLPVLVLGPVAERLVG